MADLRPVVLLSSDFEPKTGTFYSDQCDCACSGDIFPTLPSRDIKGVVAPPASCIKINLGDTYAFMLNPWSTKGGAVMNVPAQCIWETLQTSRSLSIMPDLFKDPKGFAITQKLRKAGLLWEVESATEFKERLPRTLSVWLQMTNMCNLRCDYCYIRPKEGSMQELTAHRAIDAVIRAARNNNFEAIKLKFSGGEPTLVSAQVFDLYAYAQRQAAQSGLGLDAVILSNGVALNKQIISELKSLGIRVMLSLDGIGQAHDAQRKFADGRGSFVYVEHALDDLLSAGIKPSITITVSNRNATGLADVTQYVLERDLPFNFNFCRNNECAAGQPDLELDNAHIIQGLQEALRVIETHLPDRSLLGALVDRSQFACSHEKTCGVGESYLVIDTQGRIAKCQMTIERPVTSIYAEDPLADIRNDRSGIQNLRVDEKEGCRDCEWRYWCGGGCPLLTYRTTGRYDVKSPYCEIYKAIYPELLRLEGLRILKLAKVGPFA